MAVKTNGKTNGQNGDQRARIAIRAYEIYVQEGRPAGRAVQHWLTAESEFLVKAQPKTPKPQLHKIAMLVNSGEEPGRTVTPR